MIGAPALHKLELDCPPRCLFNAQNNQIVAYIATAQASFDDSDAVAGSCRVGRPLYPSLPELDMPTRQPR